MNTISVPRVRTWRTELLRWAQSQIGLPFTWGQTDCGTLGRAALRAMFGRDIVEDWPSWNTPHRAALRLLACGTFGQVLVSLGGVPKAFAFVQAGDFVVNVAAEEVVGGEALMVCVDEGRFIGSGPAGVCWMVPDAPRAAYTVWEARAHGE